MLYHFLKLSASIHLRVFTLKSFLLHKNGSKMRVENEVIEGEGKIKGVERSKLPHIVIITAELNGLTVRFDLHEELLNELREGDKVRVSLTGERPEFNEGSDIVLWGYVMSKKKAVNNAKEVINKLLVSLWGYLLVLESKEDILQPFSIMDKVYFKVSKLKP